MAAVAKRLARQRGQPLRAEPPRHLRFPAGRGRGEANGVTWDDLGLEKYSVEMHSVPRRAVVLPNGSRLSCGRNARGRKAVQRQIKRLVGEATQFFLTCE